MITHAEQREARANAADRLRAAGIVLTDSERETIEVTDFVLSRAGRSLVGEPFAEWHLHRQR